MLFALPMRHWTLAVAIVCAVAANSAIAQTILPFKDASDVGKFMDEEDRIWTRAIELDTGIEKSGNIESDSELTTYLQSIAAKLYPEFQDKIKVRIYKSPHLNAFALANGSVYVNQGLLARMRNEAQLAALIGHESAHFVHRHGFANQRSAKRAGAFAAGARALLIPLFGDLLALSSIYGYSRELESEADRIGFQRMRTAGYDAREAIALFRTLEAEAKAIDSKEPFMFASHPKLQERIANFQKLVNAVPAQGELGTDTFLLKTAELRSLNLQSDIAMGRFASTILVLEDPRQRILYGKEADYYLGEAYRLRGKSGDEPLMMESYQRAFSLYPEFAPTYRAAGIAEMKKGNAEVAASHFNKYLELAPNAADRAYVEAYAKQLY